MEILYTGLGWIDIIPMLQARLTAHRVQRADPSRSVIEQIADVEVLLPSNRPANREVIAAAKKLVLIQQPAVGYEGIDLDAARERGIPVCNAPGSNPVAVAEAALLLMLALARRYKEAQQTFARAVIGQPLGLELSGRALGLVGNGQSARRLGTTAAAMGMRVVAIDSRSTRFDLLDLARKSDVLSLHCPLTDRTRGSIDAEVLSLLPEGALLINAARGGIIDRPSLEAALASGRLGGVGLDVYWKEPWDPLDPLFARDDVVTLPHVGGTTREAFARVADIAAENVRRFVAGEALLHRIA